MTGDEIYEGLTGDEAETLRSVEGLLGDASVWAEVPAGLEEEIVSTITAENRFRRRPGRGFLRNGAMVLAGAAAAVALIGVISIRGGDSRGQVTEVALPAPGGGLEIEKKGGGWRIDLNADLPRVEGDRHYQASLIGPDGTRIPLGTFNDGRDIILWAGVSPKLARAFVITIEPGGQEVLRTQLPG